jgi:hypothetical protein
LDFEDSCSAPPSSGAAASATAAFPVTDFGQGRPVTARDLSGKSFCYSNGVRTQSGQLGDALQLTAQTLTAARNARGTGDRFSKGTSLARND